MKLDDYHVGSKKEGIEISIQKKQEKEQFIFKGELHPKPNQRVFKIDLYKGIVSECQFVSTSKTVNYFDVINNTGEYAERKIIVKEGYDYIVALNMKNALKHFKRSWSHLDIDISEDNSANTLKKNQKEVKKYSSH